MVPSFNGGSDVIWICAPGEGFGDFVGFCDESVDSGLEIDEAVANPKTDSSVWRRPLAYTVRSNIQTLRLRTY